jgi:hypothetical protein
VAEVYSVVNDIDDAYEKIIIFKLLMNFLSPAEQGSLLESIINLVKDVKAVHKRAKILGYIADNIPIIDMYPLWHDILRHASLLTRRELFGALRFLFPSLGSLGGEKSQIEMANSIRTIVDRWP